VAASVFAILSGERPRLKLAPGVKAAAGASIRKAVESFIFAIVSFYFFYLNININTKSSFFGVVRTKLSTNGKSKIEIA
jgi:hypothetical protein